MTSRSSRWHGWLRVTRRLCAGMVLAACPPAAADVYLAVGPGGAMVTETRQLAITGGVQEVRLDGLPAETDWSTLMIRSRRMEVELLQWSAGEERAPDGTGPFRRADDSAPLEWIPLQPREKPDAQAPRSVRCLLRAPQGSSTARVDVLYRVSGLSWEAVYQVVVRGDAREEREPLSVDLLGAVLLINRTSRTFSNATVRLVGASEIDQGARDKPPGFLLLDEHSPLADLWRPPPPEAVSLRTYRLPEPVTLPAGASAEVALIHGRRIPAARRYILRADEFPPDIDRPLRKQIVVANTALNRLGVPLPPGRARLFTGSLRAQAWTHGLLPHTPAGGELCIDLGPSAEVIGRRSLKSSLALGGGGLLETYTVGIVNDRSGAIDVAVEEKPPVVGAWSVVRSSKPYREVLRRLLFDLEIGAGRGEQVDYTVRVQPPGL